MSAVGGLALPLCKRQRFNHGDMPIGAVVFNVYDANNNAVGCQLSEAEADAITLACNTHPALVSALEKCIRDFENMDENQPTDAGCIDCTAGTVPNHLNTGRCGYHEAKVALRLARGEGK